MPDVPFGSEHEQSYCPDNIPSDCNAVCIDAARIYDSCGAKDCLRDLPVMFTQENQMIVENACSCRVSKVNVITSTVDVEPVAFHRGFYAVNMMFYFAVTCDIYTTAATIPSTITGLATYGKRVVLYGSDGCVKTFSSDTPIECASADDDCNCSCSVCVPKATVQISDPMALSAKLVKCHGCGCNEICGAVPDCVTAYFGGVIVQPTVKYVSATIGIFTITQLIRNVQLLIPSYDFCVPRKECSARTDDPCEVFSKIEFPTDSFFPPNVGEKCNMPENPFECSCNGN
ncbi:MAG: hypothetical protein MJ089_06010 [Ruminococcus sp.]|nr:hypothetical protein [Ruminococcus sp.]